ncbi:hypothetical protein DMI66_00925 [Escherichia coli]|nr:hypothetical protein [Escherichia coli]
MIYMFVLVNLLLININYQRDGIVKGQFCEGLHKTSVKGIKGRNKSQKSCPFANKWFTNGQF